MIRNHTRFLTVGRIPSSSYVAAFVVLLSFGAAAFAQDQNRARLTINDLAAVDEDFHLMGEYQGQVWQNGSCCPIGLQVVALGDGEFSAMQYACGLPGTGWNKVDREQLTGWRDGDTVKLEGESTHITVSIGCATVFDTDGRLLGQIGKVHRQSPTLGMPAPHNAQTLFDGTNTDAFKAGQMTEDGLLKEGTELIPRFRDFTLHAEYRLPYMPYARGQGRSNSGLYLQSSYEVQVLDSFGLEGVENECGALYRYKRPDQNMCLPPLQWQTYDLTFRSPRFDSEGNKIQNARITVLHNGVAVHDDFEIERKTGAGKPEEDILRPIKFQDHSNPVRFRNIWVIDLERPVMTAIGYCDTAVVAEPQAATEPPAPSTEEEVLPAPVATEPTPAEPTPAEPTPAEPTPAEPVPAEPTPAEPTGAEPTPAEPTPAEPIATEPTPAEPVPAAPTPAEPAPAEPPAAPVPPAESQEAVSPSDTLDGGEAPQEPIPSPVPIPGT